ncbi:YhdH/YhfP family quinone oxidoreductase [Gammaproteobacteria bacterium]|nr:YhdH/YhfP family quinone oxidoreductase [Gammaproteobacteria bacterium]
MKYKAYLIEQIDDQFNGSVQELDKPEIETGHLIINVHYSSLNYKDALASTGVKGVAKTYPFVPGIDVVGTILESADERFSEGDIVVATGYKIGMAVHGGFGEIVHLPADWVLHLPENMEMFDAMSIGTAGITAAACVKKIIDSGISKDLPVLISGATGGVGSVAVNILSKLGYEVHAITGKTDEDKTLLDMGATEIIQRSDYMAEPARALDKAKYAGAVDTVGGDMLAKMISMITNEGAISCCGNVGGMKFTSSVFPFILRGVSLIGIDSAESPIELKKELWKLLSSEWQLDLKSQTKEISLDTIGEEVNKILQGQQVGRIVIKHGA